MSRKKLTNRNRAYYWTLLLLSLPIPAILLIISIFNPLYRLGIRHIPNIIPEIAAIIWLITFFLPIDKNLKLKTRIKSPKKMFIIWAIISIIIFLFSFLPPFNKGYIGLHLLLPFIISTTIAAIPVLIYNFSLFIACKNALKTK